MTEKPKRKGVQIHLNYGMGYFAISFRGERHRLYTGRPLEKDAIATDPWFNARADLLAEMVKDGTFTLEKAKALIGETPQRQTRPAKKVTITVQEFGEEWLERKKTVVSAGKVAEYRETLAFLCALDISPQQKKQKALRFGGIQLRDLRAQHVDWLVNTLSEREGIKGEKISNSRLNDLLLKVVRPLLDLAYERDYLGKNPHSWIQKRRVESPDDIDPFSFDEMLAFLAVLPDPKWVRFYTVAFGTGLRTSEQFALQWQHVNFAENVLHIRQGYVKGRTTILKTAVSRRDIDLLPHVAQVLQEHHEVVRQYHTDKELAIQYVFTNSDGGVLHRDNLRNRIWNPTVARARLRPRNPYQTRHTFASLMLYEGEDPAWVARMLGHTDLRMVYERYAKYVKNRTRQDGTRFSTALHKAMAKTSVDRL
jgi:integrase